MASFQKFVARKLTLSATPNTVVQLYALLIGLTPTPTISQAMTQVVINNNTAGNLLLTDNPNALTENDGFLLASGDTWNMEVSGSDNDIINTTEMYVLSATASKTFIASFRSEIG